MYKMKICGRVALVVAMLFCLLFCTPLMGVKAGAEAVTTGTEQPVEEVPAPPADEAQEGDLGALVQDFIERLKDTYGAEYETYYNAIIAEWGSVEAYLLSLMPENAPDAVASGWKAFVKWLGDYAPIWGSILAIAAVIIVAVVGKKVLKKVVEWITGMNKKFKTMVAAFNTLYANTKAQNDALTKLLGDNPRYEQERKALEEASKEIDKDEQV